MRNAKFAMLNLQNLNLQKLNLQKLNLQKLNLQKLNLQKLNYLCLENRSLMVFLDEPVPPTEPALI